MEASLSRPLFYLLTAGLVACSDAPRSNPLFEDVTELSGIQFVHENAGDGNLALPFILGSGVALFDVDGDGDLDVYLVQGASDAGIPDEIWLNETVGDRLRFSRLPDQAALGDATAGVGVAISDVDLDGRLDVLVTTVGRNRLLLNTVDGFVASTSNELRKDRMWSSSALWFDANGDQRPDLYIANVAQFDPGIVCWSDTRRPDYCGADAYVPLHDQLLLNFGKTSEGDVVFEDASEEWNLDAMRAPTLGVRSADFDGDGRPDIFASAYGMNNALWMNRDGREFQERGQAAGVAASFLGRHRDSLGVDAADVDRDGDIDLIVAHDLHEPHQLYLNDGRGNFIADALVAGGASEAQSGSGVVVLDANADGRPDAFVANGAVRQRQEQYDAGDAFPLREPNVLLLQKSYDSEPTAIRDWLPPGNAMGADERVPTDSAATPEDQGDAVARARDAIVEFEVSQQIAGRLTPRPEVSRSVASGDLDNDGDVDLVITNNGGAARLLRSTLNPDDWIGIDPVSAQHGTTLVGTEVRLIEPVVSGVRQVRRSHGFLSSSDPRQIYYGVLEGNERVVVLLTWPGGESERFVLPAEPRYHALVRGQGQP